MLSSLSINAETSYHMYMPLKCMNKTVTRKKKEENDLLKEPPVVRRNQMMILGGSTSYNMLPEVINRRLVRPEGLHTSPSTVSQACYFTKCDTLSLNFLQRLTTIQHGLIKPPPGAYKPNTHKSTTTKFQPLRPQTSKTQKVAPLHFLPGSMESALSTMERLANPQYAGSDCVWKWDISLKKPSIVPL